MSAALHKQTYTGLKPSGSFIKIKTATTGGVSGLGSDSAGFPHRASIRTHPLELKWSHSTQPSILTPMTQSFRGFDSLEESLHITTFILFFFLIKNINISGVQKYHR